jgi:hypothetical protein
VGAGVGLEGDLQAPVAEGADGPLGLLDRNPAVPFAMDDQDSKPPAILDPAEGSETAREPAIDGDDSGEPLGVRHGHSISHGRTFADSDEEDPLGMNVQRAASLADGIEDPVFKDVDRIRLLGEQASAKNFGIGESWAGWGTVATGKVRPPAVAAGPALTGDDFGASQAQAHVVPPAHRGHRLYHLLLVAPSSVEQDQERIRIIRLVSLWDIPGLDERASHGVRAERRCVPPVVGHPKVLPSCCMPEGWLTLIPTFERSESSTADTLFEIRSPVAQV